VLLIFTSIAIDCASSHSECADAYSSAYYGHSKLSVKRFSTNPPRRQRDSVRRYFEVTCHCIALHFSTHAIVTLTLHHRHAFRPRHWWSAPTIRHPLTDIDSPATSNRSTWQTAGKRDLPILNNRFDYNNKL